MLGKLIKHEFKSTYKMCGLLLVIIAVVSLIGAVGFSLPLDMLLKNERVLEESFVGVVWIFTMVVSMLLYIFTMLGVMYAIMIYLGVRFYKSMYSDEGYLTQTLPVTPHQLLISKIVTAGIWYLILEILMAISVFVLMFAMFSTMSDVSGITIDSTFAGIYGESSELLREFGMSSAGYFLTILFVLLVSPFAAMATLFGAVTIGQLAKKYKALMGILVYFGIVVVEMIASNILTMAVTVRTVMVSGVNSVFSNQYVLQIALCVCIAVGLYFVSHHILSKKLNME